jgi:hypothetical protein
MSDPKVWPKTITKAWFCFEALRRLGFQSDDIEVGAVLAVVDRVTRAEGIVARVELRTQGRVFGIHVPPAWDGTIESFIDLWNRFAARVTRSSDTAAAFTDAELQTFWDLHVNEADLPVTELPMALMHKGFEIPSLKKVADPVVTWTGPRTVAEAVEQHSMRIAQMTKQMVEQGFKTQEHLCLVVEHDYGGFAKLRNLIGIKRSASHDVLVLLVGREYGTTRLAGHGIVVPATLLRAADSVEALPMVVCGPEGYEFSHVVVHIERSQKN